LLPSAAAAAAAGVDGLPWQLHLQAAQQLLQQALQLATALPAAAAAAAAVAAGQQSAAADEQQQQQPVRLPNFRNATMINMAGTAGMLAALPAHSLTRLDLTTSEWQRPVNSAAVSAALARLSNLQQLRLCNPQPISGCCLVQLTRLTLLDLDCSGTPPGELQQLFDQPLSLQVLRMEEAECWHALDLSQQMHLREYSDCAANADTVLPAPLQKLRLGSVSNEHLERVLQLQQLRDLDFESEVDKPELLLRVAQLPTLESLALRHCTSRFAAATAAAWSKLPQLVFLSLQDSDDRYRPPTKQQWEVI
jgi:hypothetical protein